jgi:SAM-dependent methyltransferase
MPVLAEEVALSVEEPEQVRAVRRVLDRAGYNAARIVEALGIKEIPLLFIRPHQRPMFSRRLGPETSLGTLLRLFAFDQAVEVEVAARAVAPMRLEDWSQLGLLRLQDGRVEPAVRLYPHNDLVFVIDGPAYPQSLPTHVMGVGATSRTLAQLTIRRPVERALDLGTGCGFQAFLAAAHSKQVVAVDRNPRAVRLTAFSALLNNLTHVSALEGDFFQPVEGQQFDLIVGNLPYVMSPKQRYLFCDSPLPGDQLAQTVTRTAAARLNVGGYGQFLCNWAHLVGQEPAQRLATWFAGSGCDVLALGIRTLSADEYAVNWLAETMEPDPNLMKPEFDAWMEFYDREHIEAITVGLLTLRRGHGQPNWFRYDTVGERVTPRAELVLQQFALRDFLETVRDDQALLNARLRTAPGLRWSQDLEPTPESWTVIGSHFRHEPLFGPPVDVDRNVAALAQACNGQKPLREVLAAFAQARNYPLDQITPTCLQTVRQLLTNGYLVSADNALPGPRIGERTGNGGRLGKLRS